jgi:hypothetical protein
MFLEGIVGGTLSFRKQLWSNGVRFPDTSMAGDAECLKSFLIRGAN